MEIKASEQNGVMVMELSGRLEGSTAPQAQAEIMKYVQPKALIVLDMTKCDYVSSAGLRVLLMMAKQLASIGGSGVLSGLIDEIKDVMHMTGFDNIFKAYNTISEAVEAVRKGAS